MGEQRACEGRVAVRLQALLSRRVAAERLLLGFNELSNMTSTNTPNLPELQALVEK